jgi:class 3 adenylate cyclase
MTATDFSLRIDVLRQKTKLGAPLLDAFEAFVTSAPDEALFRMSPFRYAATHGLSEQDGLELFLHATHVGILDFAWGMLCPGCMAFFTTPGGLRSLESKHCTFCGIDIEGSIDDRVEIAFTVARSVRRIRFHSPGELDLRVDAIRLHFSPSLSPDSIPHQLLARGLVTAAEAPAGEVHTARFELPEGYFVLLTPAGHVAVYLNAQPGGPSVASFELLEGRAIPDKLSVGTGPIELRIQNRTTQTAAYFVAPINLEAWPEPARPGEPLTHPVLPYLTGQRLVSSQTFRDLFRAESIPSEGGLELRSVTVLFTDLTGSTALYERVGDLRAYDLVRKHFAVLRSIAAAHGGAIVKTIGDAIMASFAEPTCAMRAAIRMNLEIAELKEADLLLKIGLHTGPCIAVELNERLDYFGRTVNIAARVQGLATAGEIVCTDAVYDALGVAAIVEAAGLRASRATAPLKGIAEEVPVVRMMRAAGVYDGLPQ